MLAKSVQTLVAPLAQNGTLKLAGTIDPIRFASVGGVAVVGSTRYVAPTDFTMVCDGRGYVTLTWLNAATLGVGSILTVGVPLLDAVTGSDSSALATALADNSAVPVKDGGQPYIAVLANATTVLGTGAIGDTLAGIKINPGATPADIAIKDGASTIFTIKAAAMTANVPYDFWAGWISKVGGWSVVMPTTPSGIALGKFTP